IYNLVWNDGIKCFNLEKAGLSCNVISKVKKTPFTPITIDENVMILLTVSLIPSIIVKKYKKAVNKLKKIEIKLECFSQTPSSVSNNFSIFCPQPPYSSYSNEPILFLIHIFVYQISQEKFDI